jgi:hypothetical protein
MHLLEIFPMNSLKRDIVSGLAMSAVALVFALAYGSPFVSPRAAHADDSRPQVLQQKDQSQLAVQSRTKPHPGTLSPTTNR